MNKNILVGLAWLSLVINTLTARTCFGADLQFPACSRWTIVSDGEEKVVKAAFSSVHSVVLFDSGRVACFGRNLDGECHPPPFGSRKCIDVAAGFGFSLALMDDHSLVTWGSELPVLSKSDVVAVVAEENSVNFAYGDGGISNIPSAAGFEQSRLSTVKEIKRILPGSNCSFLAKDGSVGGIGPLYGLPTGAAFNFIVGGERGGESNYAYILRDGSVGGAGPYWKEPPMAKNCHALAWSGGGIIAGVFDHYVASWGLTGSSAKFRIRHEEVSELVARLDVAGMITRKGVMYANGSDRNGSLRIAKTPRVVDRVKCSSEGGLVVLCEGGLPVWLFRAGETAGLMPVEISSVKDAASCNNLICVVMPGGELRAWGRNGHRQCEVPAGLPKIREIAVGSDFIVALGENGSVHCFGDDRYGACRPPSGLPKIVKIAAGKEFAAALTTLGVVEQWGSGLTSDVPSAIMKPRPRELGKVVDFSAGASHLVVLTEEGKVYAWGANAEGQCDVPADLKDVVGVTAGDLFTAALDRNGRVRIWGDAKLPGNLPQMKSISAGSGVLAGVTLNGEVAGYVLRQSVFKDEMVMPYGVFKTYETKP